MKKFSIAALAALAALAACTKNEVTPLQSAPQQISLTPLNGKHSTKALIDGTAYPTTETFGTFAYFNANGTTFPASADVYIPESEVKNTTLATTGTAWTTDPAYYWPKQGSLTFFSYSPYSINTSVDCDTTNGITITDWDVDANQTVDVMVADYKTGQMQNGTNGGYTGVPTIFRHKLSQIVEFKFATKENYHGDATTFRTEATAKVGDKFFYINSVKINNIEYKGSYKSGNNVNGEATPPVLGDWTATTPAATKSYTWYEDSITGTAFGYDTEAKAPTPGITNGYLLVLPQQKFAKPANLDDVSGDKNIQITYTIKTCTKAADADSGTAAGFTTETVKDVYASLWAVHNGSGTADADTWQMNKKISYTITIGLDQIYWAPNVEGWDTQSFGYEVK